MNTRLTFFRFLSISFVIFLFSTNSYAFELVCPADVTVDCGEEIWDLDIYGTAKYHDYTGWHWAGEPQVEYHLNSCNTGYVLRTWTVMDPYNCDWVSCSQRITIANLDINGSFITWPNTGLELTGCDISLDPNSFPEGYQKPSWNTPDCAVIGVSYKDKIFTFGGACKKLVRTWTVIDCCTFNPYTGEGTWIYNQEVQITVSDIPQVICPDDIIADATDCDGGYVFIPSIEIPDSDCSEFVVVMNDSPYANSPTDASGIYPLGTTEVTFVADFGCWQKTMCTVNITVLDTKAPTPICMNGLAIALMGIDTDGDGTNDEGMIEVWASDFDLGSFDFCETGELTFSFSSDVNDNVRSFTCDDVGRNDIEMWVTDSEGNQDFCSTYVKVQNNEANIIDCEDNDAYSTLSGTITSHYGGIVANANIMAVGTEHEFEIIETTQEVLVETVVDSVVNSGGVTVYFIEIDTIEETIFDTTYQERTHHTEAIGADYYFDYLPHYNDYIIEGQSIDATFDYINLADVLYIKEFIAGNIEFNFYQKMAADVNKDGVIDMIDVELLENVIETGQPWDGMDNDWHFFDASMKMSDETSSHDCEEFCKLNDLNEDTYKVNLKGYRIGDVTDAEISTTDNDDSYPVVQIERRNKIFPSLQIQPNPFNKELSIEIDVPTEQLAIFMLFDGNGRVVLSKELDLNRGNQILEINPTDLSNGIYHYQVILNTTILSGKVIKI